MNLKAKNELLSSSRIVQSFLPVRIRRLNTESSSPKTSNRERIRRRKADVPSRYSDKAGNSEVSKRGPGFQMTGSVCLNPFRISDDECQNGIGSETAAGLNVDHLFEDAENTLLCSNSCSINGKL
jgi:hypothetical protein